MSANWEMCLFCQEKKTQRKGVRENIIVFKKFIEIDPTCLELSRLNDRVGIAKTLKTHNGVCQ